MHKLVYCTLLMMAISSISLNASEKDLEGQTPIRTIKFNWTNSEKDIILRCINESGKRTFISKGYYPSMINNYDESHKPDNIQEYTTYKVYKPVYDKDEKGVLCKVLEIDHAKVQFPNSKGTHETKVVMRHTVEGTSKASTIEVIDTDIIITRNAEKGFDSYLIPIAEIDGKPVSLEIFIAKDREVLRELLPEKEKWKLDYIPGLDKRETPEETQ